MRIQVGDARLFFDVEGTKLVAEGPWMRERQTVVLIHPGPGFDHGLFKVQLGPWLSAGTQVVYTDLRGGGRSDRSTPEERSVERWADDVKDLCDAIGVDRPVVLGLGFGSVVVLKYAARHPDHPAALVLAAPVARIVAERSIEQYERLGGPEARAVAERFYDGMDEQGFADFLRVCFPLLSSYALTSDVIARADWNPAVLIEWMAGEAKELDLRDELAAISAPALVLAGEDDAWAPLESVREVFDLLPGRKQFRSYTRGRHSVFRDAPEAYEDMRLFLDEIDAGEPAA
jgi:proline iminopeptidase